MRLPTLALGLLALLFASGAATAGLTDRVTSAGQFTTDALAAFGRIDAPGMYDAAIAYAGRESGWASATYDLTVRFVEEEYRSTTGPVGGFVYDTAGPVAGAALGPVESNAAAARQGANTCFQGWFPAFGVSNTCLAARGFAEGVLGRPLPPL